MISISKNMCFKSANCTYIVQPAGRMLHMFRVKLGIGTAMRAICRNVAQSNLSRRSVSGNQQTRRTAPNRSVWSNYNWQWENQSARLSICSNHKPHITCPGTDPGLHEEKPATSHLSNGSGCLRLLIRNISLPCRYPAMQVTKIPGNSDTFRILTSTLHTWETTGMPKRTIHGA
jgi:hypothetical protein